MTIRLVYDNNYVDLLEQGSNLPPITGGEVECRPVRSSFEELCEYSEVDAITALTDYTFGFGVALGKIPADKWTQDLEDEIRAIVESVCTRMEDVVNSGDVSRCQLFSGAGSEFDRALTELFRAIDEFFEASKETLRHVIIGLVSKGICATRIERPDDENRNAQIDECERLATNQVDSGWNLLVALWDTGKSFLELVDEVKSWPEYTEITNAIERCNSIASEVDEQREALEEQGSAYCEQSRITVNELSNEILEIETITSCASGGVALDNFDIIFNIECGCSALTSDANDALDDFNGTFPKPCGTFWDAVVIGGLESRPKTLEQQIGSCSTGQQAVKELREVYDHFCNDDY